MRRPTRNEQGESLLELVIAVAILGIAVVAIAAGISVSIIVADTHRKQATAGFVAKSYAEAIEQYVASGGYAVCAAPSSYQPATVSFPVRAGFTPTSSAAMSWTGAGWSTCTADTGVQKVTVTVTSDGRATESIDVVLRKP
jgi:Tfp pilus assembly protein PilE